MYRESIHAPNKEKKNPILNFNNLTNLKIYSMKHAVTL